MPLAPPTAADAAASKAFNDNDSLPWLVTSDYSLWLKLLLHEDMPLDVLQSKDPSKAIPPLHGALLKNEQDIMLFERLAFMSRRQGA